MRTRFTGLWRNPDFLKLWSGQTISVFGSLIGRPALSFAAILTLHASPLQMGLLAVFTQAPGFLIGLPAGVWVDRLRKRPLLIAADLGRAAILVTIPIFAWLGYLSLGQLYAAALLAGLLTIFFDVAYQSYLPALVQRDELVEANSKLQGTESIAEIGGFGLAGIIVQVLSAPAAILIDAVTFLWSALFVSSIRRREPDPAPAAERESLRTELNEGLRAIWRDRMLRALAGSTLTMYFGFGTVGSLITLFCVRDLGISPGPLGVIWCVGGLSSLAGAATAGRVTRRLGLGRTLVVMAALSGLFMLFVPAAAGAPLIIGACLVAQQLFVDYVEEIHSIDHVSLRQAITPERLLGRVNATTRFLQSSAQLIGALLGGVLGQAVGVRPTLVLACFIVTASALWLAASPIRALRETPALPSVPDLVRPELA
ncbi:MAG: MFS transporter [Dehalococcoidia bacterium]